MKDTNSQTTLDKATERAILARNIAKSLMMFPFSPQPGMDGDEFFRCLEISFTLEITRKLNEAANANTGI